MPRRPSAVVRSVAPVAAALAMLCALACESPTLPLPPPEAPIQSPGVDADHVKLTASCGGAQDGAIILILNQTLEAADAGDQAVGGSIANGCGGWDAMVLAHTGDNLAISQESGTQGSDATIYTVR
jgi:hypothetical protein